MVMSLEIIKSIKQAEQEAERVVEASIIRARDIVSDAEKQRQTILGNALKEAKQESDEIMKKSEAKAQEEVQKILKRTEEEIQLLKKETEPKINRAIDFIIEKVVKVNGNS